MDTKTYQNLSFNFNQYGNSQTNNFQSKVLKDGRHKIRVAVCHKQETCYIITRFIIDNLSQFKNGQVVKRPDAAMINTKLRNLLNKYQERLDKIDNLGIYSCTQLKDFILRESVDTRESFKSVCHILRNCLKTVKPTMLI